MACYSSFALLFFLCGVSLAYSLRNGFSVELIHRDSPKSPLHRPSETHFLRVSKMLRRSFNRANHFHKGLTRKQPESNVMPDDFDYIMSYSVGTPPFKVYGAIDTGSDFVWIQCQPCKSCYNQTTQIFDPSKSKSYKNLPCSSPKCIRPRYHCSSSNTCIFEYLYGNGTDQTLGDVSLETLTFESTSSSHVSFHKIVIGCGHSNVGSFRGRMSGIVGLGGGQFSLNNQLGSSNGKFSYCLVPMFSGSSMNNASSKLNFGDAAKVSGHGTVSTPMTIIFNSYVLALEAFSVGDKRIANEPPRLPATDANIVIDSGSSFTFLSEDVYNKLESAVADIVKSKRVEDPNKAFNLCYEGTLDLLKIPVITAHFKGADIRLNAVNTFLEVADRVVCFTFLTHNSEKIGTFGSLAHQNFLVGYDLQKNIISFKPTDCTKH